MATIANGGLALALAEGQTLVTASLGSIQGSTLLTVLPEALVSILVTPEDSSLARGSSRQFQAIGTFSNATTQDLTASALWSSSAPEVASDAGGGLFLAHTPGTTTLTAEVGSLAGSTSLAVYLALARTGQTTCYDAAGGVIPCAGTGQDGELLAGAPWPAQRFTLGTGAETGSVRDDLTGLAWLRAPDGTTPWSWLDALSSAAGLNACGHDDWRLPTRRELRSLIHNGWPNTSTWLAGQGFAVLATDYWTCSTLASVPDNAWNTDMYFGVVDVYDKAGGPRLWAVRTADENAPCRAARSGQSSCYDETGSAIPCAGTSQDGELRSGVPWPIPRFVVGQGAHADGVLDRLTGLEWPRFPDPNLRTWQEALDYANGLVLCGQDDWRLPNVTELESLYHAEFVDSAAWLNTQGFAGASWGYQWSSTTVAVDPTHAWALQLGLGYVFHHAKGNAFHALAVRGP